MTLLKANELGVVMNHKKMLRIMTNYGLCSRYIKNLRSNYTKQLSLQQPKVVHFKRRFHHQGCVTDITYFKIMTHGKRDYLSTIFDLEARYLVRSTLVPKTTLN